MAEEEVRPLLVVELADFGKPLEAGFARRATRSRPTPDHPLPGMPPGRQHPRHTGQRNHPAASRRLTTPAFTGNYGDLT
jgi:hypothetical protein